MTLTHNVSHDWADAHAGEVKNNGLSDFGKDVVREMNRLGMLIDISHVSVKGDERRSRCFESADHRFAFFCSRYSGSYQEMCLTRFSTRWQNGGVIMVNFYPGFLDARTNNEENARTATLKPQMDALAKRFENDPKGLVRPSESCWQKIPIYIADYNAIVDHIDHIKKVAA
jgi:membrane dipeptidase